MKVVKSSFAACAVFMAASAFAAATVDENGLTPTLWYQFEGDFASYGSQAVTWNNFATTADYFETINGRRALKYNSKDPYTSKIDDFTPYFGANGFTIATYCRMSSVNKRATVSFGSLKDAYANHELMLVTANDSTNVRIAYQGADGTKLSPVDGVNPGTRTAFHHYAITCTPNVDESTASVTNWTVALYVDGTKQGSGTIPGVPTKGGIQLFNVFDDSGTGYSGSATGASVDDLRIYDQVLTEEQIQQMNRIAQATRDAQGRYPNVWLSLDGNMDSQGLVTLAWGTGDGITYSDNYIATPTGKALYYWSLTEGKRHDPYTSGANVPEILGESGFTVMTSARMGTGTKNTLFGIGSMTAGSMHELILAQGGTLGQVALVDAVKGAVATVVSTNVSDCARVLHHYAVSVAPGEGGYAATLYVDGALAGTGTLGDLPSGGGLQFFNVYQNDGSGYNADLVGAAMDDFRIYTEVLDAATIAAYASEFPVFVRRDENDSAVDVWMRFDGDSAQDGLDDIGISSSSAWAGTYETSRQGKALKTSKDSYSSATGVDFGDGDWTLVLSARAQVVTDGQPTCLWTFGKKQDTANTLGFFATEGGLMVSTWSNQSLAEAPIFNLTDAKLAKSINTYALVYTKATGALELFLNGVSQGSVPAPATAAIQGQVTWQLVSLYDGVFGSLTRYNYTGAVDDFRLYKKALTTTEVQTVAAANRPYPSLDENTVRPAYWYMFDGNLSAEGSRSWTVGGNSAVTYKTEDNGIQALDISVTHPYGTGISFGDSGWTVVLRAMGEATDNAVIMGLGDRRSNNAFAFVMGGKSSFTVATWTYPGNDTDVVGHEHLFNVTVFNAHRQYHDYALVYEPPTSTEEDATGTLTLYVDGKNRGSVAKTLNMEGQWQIGSVYSGPAQVELVRSSASRVDDFRLYTEVLTAEQIGRIAAANPVWPYYSIPFSIILR